MGIVAGFRLAGQGNTAGYLNLLAPQAVNVILQLLIRNSGTLMNSSHIYLFFRLLTSSEKPIKIVSTIYGRFEEKRVKPPEAVSWVSAHLSVNDLNIIRRRGKK